jgi:hypothetical protein
MRRTRFMAVLCFAVGVLVLGLPAVPAAPVPKHLMPKDESARLCFPTKVGDRMVSTLEGKELVCVITKVEKVADGIQVTQEYDDGMDVRRPNMVVVVSDKGLLITEYSGRKIDPPTWWLKLPHVANNEWPDSIGGGTRKTAGWEEVTVPAGKIRAMRVERFDAKGQANTTYWYAPGLGCIKWASAMRTRELKSFTPGK